MQYGTAELKVLAVVKPQHDSTAATASPTTYGELWQTLDIIRGQSPTPQRTSSLGCSQMSLGSEKQRSHKRKAYCPPDAAPDFSQLNTLKLVERVCFYSCILPPQLITIQKSDANEEMVTAPVLPEDLVAK